jgi:hypothetical protein
MGTNLAPMAKAIGGPNMNPLASIPVFRLKLYILRHVSNELVLSMEYKVVSS